MQHEWSRGVADQVFRAIQAVVSGKTPIEKLSEVLKAAVAVCEGEDGLIEGAVTERARQPLVAKRGVPDRIPPACLERVLRTGRSVAPPSLDGTALGDDPPNGFGPVIALPLRANGRIRGVLGLRLNGGQALDPALHSAIEAIACCAASILDADAAEAAKRVSPPPSCAEGVARAIAGDSSALTRTLSLASRAAPTNAPVLIQGESGVGKELIARRIHATSRRSSGPFHAVNVSALDDNLLDTEMFGYVKGSHSKAEGDRAGHFEAANGGTLFLDEIGDSSPALQVRLLRVLQEMEFLPVGSTQYRRLDLRVVSATNRNLKQMMKEGKFREDLYYRLCVVEIHVPPLRRRPEDIPPIVELLLRQAPAELGLADVSPISISRGAMELLKRHPWSGNGRHLKNIVHRLVIFSGRTIEERDVREVLESAEDPDGHRDATSQEVLLAQVDLRLSEHGNRKEETARSFGKSRQWLWRLRRGHRPSQDPGAPPSV